MCAGKRQTHMALIFRIKLKYFDHLKQGGYYF